MSLSDNNFQIKQYPLRKDIVNKLYDICSCGHAWHSHEDPNQRCEKCTCPKYEFQQKLTMKQLIELREKIQNSYEKTGFSQ